MSGYSRMEAGAVEGYEDRPTGPVTLYSRSLTPGTTTRALNRTEQEHQLNRIRLDHEVDIEKAHKTASRHYLAFFRHILAPYNLRNHRVTVKAAMGLVGLQVNGDWLDQFPSGFKSDALDRLREIDQMIEGQYEWAEYLNGQCLNPKGDAS